MKNSYFDRANYLLFGNMNLISLTAVRNESLPCRAFLRSEVPYFARRLERHSAAHGIKKKSNKKVKER